MSWHLFLFRALCKDGLYILISVFFLFVFFVFKKNGANFKVYSPCKVAMLSYFAWRVFFKIKSLTLSCRHFPNKFYFGRLMDRKAHGFSFVMCASLRCFHSLRGALFENRVVDNELQGSLHKVYFATLMHRKAYRFSLVMCASHDAIFALNREDTDYECAGGGRDSKLQNQSAEQLATGARESKIRRQIAALYGASRNLGFCI